MLSDRASRQRLQAPDKLLLATLLPAFAIVLSIQIHEGVETGAWRYRIVVGGAADGESYPVVDRVQDRTNGIAIRGRSWRRTVFALR
jgi:hypothetical protein